MTMQEGKVVEWRAAPGDRVEKGQIVLVIESEKAEVEIEAPAAGVLRHVYVAPDATVPCATLLAALTATPDEPFDAESFRRENAPPAPSARAASTAPAGEPGAARPRAERAGGAPVTPAARRRARNLGIDPARVPGSGPGGRVTREDVDAWAEGLGARVEASEGVFLEVPSQGEGEPLVLLPGFGADISTFALQVPELAKSHRVLGVNPRGVGLSDAPDSERYDPTTAAADVVALGDAPLHVIGASLGAATAVELALEHPERVRSLILVTPFVRSLQPCSPTRPRVNARCAASRRWQRASPQRRSRAGPRVCGRGPEPERTSSAGSSRRPSSSPPARTCSLPEARRSPAPSRERAASWCRAPDTP
jgi:pyruvate dehydrogenase E2 component (dihydrolipoamide acetyltransferase)